jgi:hypothetical protein
VAIQSLNLRFQGSWSIDPAIAQLDGGQEAIQDLEQMYKQHEAAIRSFPDTVHFKHHTIQDEEGDIQDGVEVTIASRQNPEEIEEHFLFEPKLLKPFKWKPWTWRPQTLDELIQDAVSTIASRFQKKD